MLVFAYASLLDPALARERCPGHGEIGLASLPDHRIHFPRHSERWGGGGASLTLSHGHAAWGYVYDVPEHEIAALDAAEGFHGAGDPANAYERQTVTVDLVRPDDGSVPRRIRALAYLARPTEPVTPSARYLETILRGARARRLPDEYVAELAAIAAAVEPPAAG